jgi:gliding motility-associated-like protein
MLSVTENGCTSDITSNNVVVNGIPQASFSVGSPVCEGQPTTVSYTGNSGNNAQYSWNFGTATVLSGSGQGPYQVLWNNQGTYPVSLTVSRNGCTSQPFVAQVQVLPIPQVQFTLESPVCVGEASTIYANSGSVPGMQYTWDFNGGQVLSGMQAGPYEVYWQNAGTKTVTLSLTSPQGCVSQPLPQNIVVNPTPTAVFTAETPICLNETSTFIYNGSANANASFSWNLNGGVVVNGSGVGPLEVEWTTPGIKTIILQVEENGCVSLPHQQQVNVKPIPSGYFTVQSPVCAFENTSIAYSGNAQANAQFVWDFDNGNLVSGSGAGPLQVFWETAGSKSVSLYVTENGCTSIEEVEVVLVNPIPSASFNVSGPVCIGGTSEVVYTGDALASAQFVWDFDDATVLSGTGNGPFVLEWNIIGSKTITLYLTQAGCTTPPVSHSIDVFPIPNALFSVDERVCVGAPVTLNYTGQAGLQGNYSWSVDGGIILSGSGQGPIEVMWNTPGVKTIGLQVAENGCMSPPEADEVEVIPYPTSDFIASPLVCEGLTSTITFTGSALPIADFDWDFGGATVISGSGAGPYSVNWSVPGPKVITLNISQWGCSAPESQVALNVAPSPVPNAGDDRGGCPGDTVALGGAYTLGYSYQWLPSTGLNNPNIPNPQLVLSNMSGQLQLQSYEVITTLGNCSVRDTVNVMVETLPVATFEVPDGQCLNNNSFSFSTQGNFAADASFTWNFGAMASVQQSSLAAPSGITYTQAGVYPVSLRVNTWGCNSLEFIDSVEVYEMPEAQFSANIIEGCPPLTPVFNNMSQGAGPLSFLWEMGDGNQYSQFNPQHSFESPGQHTVSLTVTSAEGCSTRYDAHALVNVFPTPRAGFTVNPQTLSTAHPLASVHDISSGATNWEYNLGDGTFETTPDFTHNYLVAGEYRITQVVTNDFGCKDFAEYALKVAEEMTFYLPNAFTPNEDGENEIFKCYGLNINEFRMEIYDRWGELVYLSKNIDEGWNGRLFNAMDQPVSQMDVYAVVVYVRDTQDPKIRRIDHRVTLVK